MQKRMTFASDPKTKMTSNVKAKVTPEFPGGAYQLITGHFDMAINHVFTYKRCEQGLPRLATERYVRGRT